MATYTVHAPPQRQGERADPERFVFLRDGFHFWAFLFGPLWLLAKRLWLVFVLYVVVGIVLALLLKLAHASATVQSLVGFVVALLVGLEAATLTRWTLQLRGWRMLGFVVGDDREMAERRFFCEWVKRAEVQPSLPPADPNYAAPVRSGAPTGAEVIGLFPEPGSAP